MQGDFTYLLKSRVDVSTVCWRTLTQKCKDVSFNTFAEECWSGWDKKWAVCLCKKKKVCKALILKNVKGLKTFAWSCFRKEGILWNNPCFFFSSCCKKLHVTFILIVCAVYTYLVFDLTFKSNLLCLNLTKTCVFQCMNQLNRLFFWYRDILFYQRLLLA